MPNDDQTSTVMDQDTDSDAGDFGNGTPGSQTVFQQDNIRTSHAYVRSGENEEEKRDKEKDERPIDKALRREDNLNKLFGKNRKSEPVRGNALPVSKPGQTGGLTPSGGKVSGPVAKGGSGQGSGAATAIAMAPYAAGVAKELAKHPVNSTKILSPKSPGNQPGITDPKKADPLLELQEGNRQLEAEKERRDQQPAGLQPDTGNVNRQTPPQEGQIGLPKSLRTGQMDGLNSLKRNDQALSARLGSLQAGREPKAGQQEQDNMRQYAPPPIPGEPRPATQVTGKDGQPAQPISKTAQSGALADRQVPEDGAATAAEKKQEEGKGASGLVEDPAFQAAQNKALSAMGPEGALAAKVLQTKAGQELEEKVVGQAVKRGWWYGFGIASGVFFSGFDFMVGAIIMDAYWFAHRKDKQLFPMKGWQKAVTLFANIAPLLYALALLFIIMFTLCNTWSTKYAIKGISYFSGSTDYCQYFDIDTSAVGNSGDALTSLPNNGGTGLCKSQAFGPASESTLSTSCFGANASAASAIAGAESGGDPTAKSSTDKCADGNSVSIGLFQINLTNHQIGGLNCPAAFTRQYTAADHSCIVKTDAVSQALYNNCVAAAQDPANNIQAACTISSNGAHWGQWGANNKCGFTP